MKIKKYEINFEEIDKTIKKGSDNKMDIQQQCN